MKLLNWILSVLLLPISIVFIVGIWVFYGCVRYWAFMNGAENTRG